MSARDVIRREAATILEQVIGGRFIRDIVRESDFSNEAIVEEFRVLIKELRSPDPTVRAGMLTHMALYGRTP